jgi:tetratricopeptide (TPR) repeat protein
VAIEGPIRELGLADVFQLLDLSRKTGVLKVTPTGAEHPTVIRFDRGGIVGIEMPGATNRLGHRLLRAGKITEGEMRRAFERQQSEPGAPLGRVLVQMGLVQEDEVRRQLRFQLEESAYEVIRWTDGYFRFEEEAPLPADDLTVRIAAESVLMESARRIDEWTTLAPRIPHVHVVPRLVGSEQDESGAVLDLRPEEWEILAEIDGRRTLRELAADIGRSEFDVARVVFGLISTGVVAAEDGELDAGDAPASTLEDTLEEGRDALARGRPQQAIRLLKRAAAEHPQRAEAHLALAQALGDLDRWREALEVLERVVRIDPLLAEGHYRLGFAAARSGRFVRAEDAWTNYQRLPDASRERRASALRAGRACAELRRALDAEVAA